MRETPYKDKDSLHPFQPPRKYVIDWDLFVEENLGKAGPIEMFDDEYLFHMFLRSLGVIHAYMRRLHVLPSGRKLCVSIKSRTRETTNKSGTMDKKCSLHATVHVMEPAERHKKVITQILEMVRKDCKCAYDAMMEKDASKRGISSPKKLQEMGDYAGFMAMDTAMTNNWHQPIQAIGSSKGDGIVFKHKALVIFKNVEGILPISLERDCDIIFPKNGDEEYPDRFPLKMAMLLAQHSASIPDQYSITYTPVTKWDQKMFGVPIRKGQEGNFSVIF